MLFAFVGRTAPLPRLTEPEMREFIREAVEKEKRAPGIAVGIIDEKGSQVIAHGLLKRGASDKVDGDTIFEIGSITKAFTALLLQDFVDRGEVKMDDMIGEFLPSSVKRPSREGKEITLYHLATHTSGLPKLPFSIWYAIWHIKDPYAGFRVKDFYKFLSQYELDRDVGAKFEYSNAGMSLLGHVLELKANTNYESLVVERICTPLSMDSTRVVLSPEFRKRSASAHSSRGKPVKGWSPSDFPGAGELRSSINDMLRFLAANIGFAPSSLSNAMRETHIPRQKIDSSESIGLGWAIKKRSNIIWHNGQTRGFTSYIAFNPVERCGVVVLANSDNNVDDIGETLIGIRQLRKVAHIAPGIYDRYTGKYQWGSTGILTVKRKDRRLFIQVTGQRKFEVFPESETEFFCKDINAQMTFVTDETGVATDLVWHQDGSKGWKIKKLKK